MKIALGCDHAGIDLKPHVIQYLVDNGIEFLDMGTNTTDSVDYPDFAEKVSLTVLAGKADLGILLCGTGLGMAISANKIKGIRAVTLSETYSARMSRAHNNANVMTMGSRVTGSELALEILHVFINTEFEGGRHQRRVEKIDALLNTNCPGE